MNTGSTPADLDAAPQHAGATTFETPAVLRLVLDTNAVLDWLLFRDKGFAPIATVIESGAAEALTNDICMEELRRVLRYPEFKLDQVRQAGLMVQYRQQVKMVEVPAAVMPADGEPTSAGTPRCKDPDDQKFLELASQQGAILVTKDKLLLQLARRVAKGGRFQILRPDLLVQRYMKLPAIALDSIR